MRSHILLSLVTLGIGAAGGTLLSNVSSPGARPDGLSGTSEWRAAEGELARQINELRLQNDQLLVAVREIQAGSLRSAASPVSMDAAAMPVELSAPVRQLVAAPEVRSAAGGETLEIRDQVRTVVEELRAIEEEEQEARRAEKLERALAENIAKAAVELGLNAYQTGEFEKTIVAGRDAIRAITDRYDDSEDDEGRRVEITAAREQSMRLLATFMNAQQLDQYVADYGSGRAIYGKRGKDKQNAKSGKGKKGKAGS